MYKKLALCLFLLPSFACADAQEKPLSWWEKISVFLAGKNYYLQQAFDTDNKQQAITAILAGANVNTPPAFSNRLPVQKAIAHQWPEVIELMIDRGLDLQKSPDLLHIAAMKGWHGVVQRLIDKGVDVNKIEKIIVFGERTPLMMANNVDMMQYLLEHGAQANVINSNGRSALHFAVERSKDIAQLLLSYGANINAKDNKGFTPLHIVAINGNPDMAEYLVANGGADINAQNNLGATPLVVAQVFGNEPVYKYLVSLNR